MVYPLAIPCIAVRPTDQQGDLSTLESFSTDGPGRLLELNWVYCPIDTFQVI